MNDEIYSVTYKKWRAKFQKEKLDLTNYIEQYKSNKTSNKWALLEKHIGDLGNLRDVYVGLPFQSKQAVIRAVFEQEISYSDGTFRIPYIEPAFYSNSLTAKEKGLLFIEQPNPIWEKSLSCSP